MIKAVFLDIDNTLLDFDAYVRESMRAGFEKFGLPSYEERMFSVFTEIDNAVWRELEQGSITYEELLEQRFNRIFSALGIRCDGTAFEEYFRGCLFDSAIPVEGATELLRYLKAKYILCAASNGPYEQQLNRLKKAGMIGYFDQLFISEKIGFSKPSGEFFALCMEKLPGVVPSEVMMIGDSVSSDMAGAAAFGMKTCFFDREGKGCNLPVDHAVCRLDEILLFL